MSEKIVGPVNRSIILHYGHFCYAAKLVKKCAVRIEMNSDEVGG